MSSRPPRIQPPTLNRFKPQLWYRDERIPDNFQDLNWLHHLNLNLNQSHQISHHQYHDLIFDSLPLSAHLSSILIFVGVFVYLHLGLIRAQELIWLTMAIGIMGYFVWERAKPGRHIARLSALRSASVLIFLILLLSPVLRTLTLSTDSDSIWALATVLIAINILLGDYNDAGEVLAQTDVDVSFPSALSINAAIFASVVLGSRLSSNADVFGLVLFAVEWFALFPLMRRDMVRKHPSSHLRPIVLNMSLAMIVLLVIYPLSASVGLIYLLVVPIGSSFGLPAIYCWVQRYKKDLRGPWDCAVPRISASS